jgi:hypothetical protein
VERKRGAKEVVSTCKEQDDESSRIKDWKGRGMGYLWGTREKDMYDKLRKQRKLNKTGSICIT